MMNRDGFWTWYNCHSCTCTHRIAWTTISLGNWKRLCWPSTLLHTQCSLKMQVGCGDGTFQHMLFVLCAPAYSKNYIQEWLQAWWWYFLARQTCCDHSCTQDMNTVLLFKIVSQHKLAHRWQSITLCGDTTHLAFCGAGHVLFNIRQDLVRVGSIHAAKREKAGSILAKSDNFSAVATGCSNLCSNLLIFGKRKTIIYLADNYQGAVRFRPGITNVLKSQNIFWL